MNCDASEQAIFDSIDDALTPESRAELETHISGCAHCRETARQAQGLDDALCYTLTKASLPADFQLRLQERIGAEAVPMTAKERAELKRHAEAQYAAGIVRLKHQWLDSDALVEWLVCAAVVAAGAWLGWHLINNWLNQPSSLDSGSTIQWVMPAVAVAFFLATGLVAALPRARRTLIGAITG